MPDYAYLIAIALGIVAGVMSAFMGGGALVVMPSLMLLGLPPISALASTRTMDLATAVSSSLAYRRASIMPGKDWWHFALPMLIGTIIGNVVLQMLPLHWLQAVIPFLLLLSGTYFTFTPHLTDEDHPPRLLKWHLALIFILIGFYNGAFGPGCAVFVVVVLNRYAGYGLTRAVGISKSIFILANFVLFLSFLIGGHIVWPIALCCVIGVVLGSQLAAKIAIKGGAKIIRPIAALTCIALSLKLLFFS